MWLSKSLHDFTFKYCPSFSPWRDFYLYLIKLVPIIKKTLFDKSTFFLVISAIQWTYMDSFQVSFLSFFSYAPTLNTVLQG